ncbi:hypothetical protein BDY19DRAFT_14569 [Irpex rosettiformis]|uniref:Uncharacterized protein n=1 Tax=Irpex rosettiformis TaxID=378272 RepID=A0ACB8UJ26_9APHY|nr:hypothetical protein BDY19DRAFT_14569 [Irpex rosettiformis]
MRPSLTAQDTSPHRKPVSPTPAETARQKFAMRPLRRSSSRIHRWVHEQQKRQSTGSADNCSEDSHDTQMPVPSGSNSYGHAYLAYPHLNSQNSPAGGRRKGSSSEASYVFVEGNEQVPATEDAVTQRVHQEVVDLSSPPTTPRKSRLLPTAFTPPSPLRNLARGITQARTFSGSSTNPTQEQSPAPSLSIFKRQSRVSLQSRSSNLAGALFAQRQARDTPCDVTTVASSTSNWGVKPPSIMGHFATASEPSRPEFGRIPRPSTSSTITRSSETTHTRPSTDTDTSGARSGYGRHASRTATPSTVPRPVRSLWSLPPDASHLNDLPGATKMLAKQPSTSVRIPLTRKPNNSVLSLTKSRRKRKLVVSGITPGDHRRYDHLRQWCEVGPRIASRISSLNILLIFLFPISILQSFGELNQITCMPNGDLHVDFRSTEVADTVCRLHASVQINGVGTVGLSWFTGKRP